MKFVSRFFLPGRRAGFTLIELMVTIAVLAILLAVAVPNLVSFIVNTELRGAINTLQTDILNARTEAIKLQRTVQVRPIAGTDWRTGWKIVVLDTGGVPGSPIVLRDVLSDKLSVGFDNTGSILQFDSAGFSRNSAGGFLAGCVRFDAAYTGNARGIVMDAAGRPRIWNGMTTATNCS
jgi:type IV fimbrial biogenesis protein FimT